MAEIVLNPNIFALVGWSLLLVVLLTLLLHRPDL